MSDNIKNIFNISCIVLGFWWLFGAFVMLLDGDSTFDRIGGFIVFIILSAIHFLLAKNYIKLNLSKEVREAKKQQKNEKFKQLKNEKVIEINTDTNNIWTSEDEVAFQERQEIYHKLDLLNEKYKTYIEKHYNLLEKIGYQYSIAINQNNIFNNETEKCIQLFKEDIAIANIIKDYFTEECIIRKQEINLPTYPSYKHLAMIYEKQERYDFAIETCINAIKLGFLRDGTTGGMQGRLAKLLKKYNQQTNKNFQYDYDKNILFNDDTGELINEESTKN